MSSEIRTGPNWCDDHNHCKFREQAARHDSHISVLLASFTPDYEVPMSQKARIFWPLLILLVLTDCTTKQIAVEQLSPSGAPHEVLGSALQFTLGYNPGTAFGIDVGLWSRPLLVLVAVGILTVLALLYRRTAPTARAMAVALALVCGGAIGNLIDRLRSPFGVVDFIDMGIGAHRFWTFNIADAGITVGAVLLVVLMWDQEQTPTSTP